MIIIVITGNLIIIIIPGVQVNVIPLWVKGISPLHTGMYTYVCKCAPIKGGEVYYWWALPYSNQ